MCFLQTIEQQIPLSDETSSESLSLLHRASGMFSREPVVEKVIRFSFHVIREAMPGRGEDGLKAFGHSYLGIVLLRFLDDGTHSIDGEEGIRLSCRQQKGTRSQCSHQLIQITDLQDARDIGRKAMINAIAYQGAE